MIQSMTGFGKSVVQLPTKKITIEIKSLNSKSLDLNARLPSTYREKELEMRKIIANALERGKIDFSLYVENTGAESQSVINVAVVKQYMSQLAAIASGDELRLLDMAVRLPDALKTERDDIDEDEFKTIMDTLQNALKEINIFRTEEGQMMEWDFLDRIGN